VVDEAGGTQGREHGIGAECGPASGPGVRAGRAYEQAGRRAGAGQARERAGLELGDQNRSGSEGARSGFRGFTPGSASFSGHSSRISDHISLIPLS
jgi:hypothetical protein